MARKKNKLQLFVITCKRCPKKITSAHGNITGNKANEKFKGICQDCITEDEKKEMIGNDHAHMSSGAFHKHVSG